MEILVSVIVIINLFLIAFLVHQQNKSSKKIEALDKQNTQFLESIEKYVEIFNEQNINELIDKNIQLDDNNANEKIKSIRDEYRLKLISVNDELTDEHEMLIDFVTLSLSLLIKTPPNLRKKIISANTGNEFIKKILISKLPTIEKHYIPISLLEVAISEDSSSS